MLLNVLFSCVPRPFTTAMIAIEMPATIRPYSNGGRAAVVIHKTQDKLPHREPLRLSRPKMKVLRLAFRPVNQIHENVSFQLVQHESA